MSSTLPASAPRFALFERMALIRAFEERVVALYRTNEIPGFVHTSIGQEGVAVGTCAALTATDYITTTHRGHGHCLAKGADVKEAMAELFGRATGLCKGKGGSMHLADPRFGILGANAIVGASIPLAIGAALTSKLRNRDRVAVAFFGDGATNQGMFHEALNLAAVWRLPVILLCENNGYSEFTASTAMTTRSSLQMLGPVYQVHAHSVDGNDVRAVQTLVSAAKEACLAGEGPVLIEAYTYRWQGHYEGDPQTYQSKEESALWKSRDPIERERAVLLERHEASSEELNEIAAAAVERVRAAEQFARTSEFPSLDEALTDVYAN